MTIDKQTFKRIYTALLTPMHENGNIDFDSLHRLVRHQIEQGIAGFYAAGSTGEAFLLSMQERKDVLEAIIGSAAKRATVIAHTGSIGTRESVELAAHAETIGADAVSAVVPFYYKPDIQELLAHYRAIMNAVRIPVLIYHYPGATGVSPTLDFYEQIAREPQCLGVKFTSMNMFEMEQIRARCGDDFLLFNGHDEVYAAGALMGADGAIGSTFNMMPKPFLDMFAMLSEKRWEEARGLQRQVNAVIGHMLRFEVIPYEKYVLHLQGVIRSSAVRLPLKQLNEAEKKRIADFYQATSLLLRHRNKDVDSKEGAKR
ncbi:4-hydroxy-tetrahydrodipicolinate synthase [Paenibacillus sp. GYB003]|uniref:4-hydroxy-tetrahydrodipicolinate synthase n=1 Tax=Paenibacillus sp. GYB003 TaxID=2994392 RepID=UPI002F964C9A